MHKGGSRSIWNPGFIGPVCLKNRIIRSAVNDAQADVEGMCMPTHTYIYRELAANGVGAVITGHIYVHKSGIAGNRQLGLDSDRHISGLAQLTNAVHEAGGVIFAQLSHAGSQADIYLSGQAPAGPSLSLAPEQAAHGALSGGDIAMIVKAFAAAARRAREAGFDGIQLHAAHGYLLSEFLSPALNKRADRYGGSLENRARLLMDICRAIRTEMGSEFPLLVKIDSEDFRPGGLTRLLMRETVHLLEAEGLLDALEISGLWGRHRARRELSDGAKLGALAYAYVGAVEFRAESDLPLILVGGIDALPCAKNLIEENVVDFVAMARPLIRNPQLVANWWKQDAAGRQGDRPHSVQYAE